MPVIPTFAMGRLKQDEREDQLKTEGAGEERRKEGKRKKKKDSKTKTETQVWVRRQQQAAMVISSVLRVEWQQGHPKGSTYLCSLFYKVTENCRERMQPGQSNASVLCPTAFHKAS